MLWLWHVSQTTVKTRRSMPTKLATGLNAGKWTKVHLSLVGQGASEKVREPNGHALEMITLMVLGPYTEGPVARGLDDLWTKLHALSGRACRSMGRGWRDPSTGLFVFSESRALLPS